MADVHGLSTGSQFGGYRIESFVARGGMGMVYKATQLALERSVALKLVAPELAYDDAFRERFKREARLAAALDHPNILPVYEAGEIDGQLFLAMRFVPGTDLDSLIVREQGLAPERAAAIVLQVASALDAAHSRGLVHRDVKPGNILIAEEYGEERAYLTDFGLTKNAATEAHLTLTGHMVGTLDYVAPEQAEGRTVDGRADTYALACVLYRAVTGRIPFDRPTDAAKIMAHLTDPPPSAAAGSSAVSSDLDAVIRRVMAKRPEDRYASSGEFARAARNAAALPVPAPLDRTEFEAPQMEASQIEGTQPEATQPEATPIARTPIETPQTDPTVVESPSPKVKQPVGDHKPARAQSGLGGLLASRRRAVYAAAAAAVVILGAGIAIAAGGGGGKGSASAAGPAPTAASAATQTATATQTTTTTDTTASQLAAYHTQVASIIPRMRAVFNRFPQAKDFGTPVFSQTALSVAAGLRGIADNLDALSPPTQLLTDHEALVTHLHEMEQAFRSVAADSDNHDFNATRTDLGKVSAALAAINVSVKRVEATA